jgi:hypothetical protein
VFNQVISDS